MRQLESFCNQRAFSLPCGDNSALYSSAAREHLGFVCGSWKPMAAKTNVIFLLRGYTLELHCATWEQLGFVRGTWKFTIPKKLVIFRMRGNSSAREQLVFVRGSTKPIEAKNTSIFLLRVNNWGSSDVAWEQLDSVRDCLKLVGHRNQDFCPA